jgi:hypothetical protein
MAVSQFSRKNGSWSLALSNFRLGPGKGKRPNPEEIFKKLDADADGSMTLDEFKKSPMAQKDEAKAEEIYKKIDANSDGSVTLEEFKAHRPPHRPGGPGGPGKGGKGKGEGGPPSAPPAELSELIRFQSRLHHRSPLWRGLFSNLTEEHMQANVTLSGIAMAALRG